MQVTIAVCKIRNERVLIAIPTDPTTNPMSKVGIELDYAEGKIPPRYPVPATLLDCTINHEQWRVMQYLRNKR